jgi:hypothetical protein
MAESVQREAQGGRRRARGLRRAMINKLTRVQWPDGHFVDQPPEVIEWLKKLLNK